MDRKKIKILLIEDNRGYARLIQKMLDDGTYAAFAIEWASSLSEGSKQLEGSDFDVILLDLGLPDSYGLETLFKISAQSPKVPIVVLTGTDDEAMAAKAMQHGAQDYLVKNNTDSDRLRRSLRYAMERKGTERRLIASREKLRRLASELSIVEERQRRHFASVVHDNIGQNLALIKLTLQSLAESISDEQMLGSMKNACELLDKTIQDAHSLTFEFGNPVLYDLGFVAAAEQWLTEQIQQKHKIKCHFHTDTQPIQLNDEINVILFQAVRELLINVIKYAKAKNVTVSIQKNTDSVQVTVEDDGVGFTFSEHHLPLPREKGGGFGLFSVRERLNYLGGDVKIESTPGQGTRIELTAPLKS